MGKFLFYKLNFSKKYYKFKKKKNIYKKKEL